VDETFIGNDPDAPKPRRRRGIQQMMKVVTLVERETGRARSVVIDNYSQKDIQDVVMANLHREAHLRTDESTMYVAVGESFRSHLAVNHGKGEYVNRQDKTIHTNTIEGYFSIFKRGMRGVYQHCAKKHLHRHLAEFDFRYSMRSALGVDDQQRTVEALKGVVGKRLTYRRPDERAEAQA